MRPTTSVIVCTYTVERWARAAAALRAVLAQRPPPDEVILVVDHNEALLARAEAELEGVTITANRGEPGLSGGRNTGLAVASADIAVFLDDDAEPDPGWLEALVAPYRTEGVVATGGAVVAVWESGRPRWLPREFDWVVGCSYVGLPMHESPIRNPIGCSMSVRRSQAVDAGGFRADLGRKGSLLAGCEETELAIRLTRRLPDSIVLYVPGSTVRHFLPASRARWSYFRSRCFQEGRSKAILSRLEGRAALSSERAYATRILPAGVLRGLLELLRGDRGGGERAAVIVAGLAITGLGYIRGRLEGRWLAGVPPQSPDPARREA